MWATVFVLTVSLAVAKSSPHPRNMHAISLEYLRDHLDEALSLADSGEVMITRDGGSNIVLVSESDWQGLQETLHLLSTPLNADRLKSSIMASREEG